MKRRYRRVRVVGDDLTSLLIDKTEELLSRLLDRMVPPATQSTTTPRAGASAAKRPPSDPHHVLGLPRTATASDVRRRVRELANIYHPDKPRGSAEKMAEITEAARVLLERLR